MRLAVGSSRGKSRGRLTSALIITNLIMMSHTSAGFVRCAASAWMPRGPVRIHGGASRSRGSLWFVRGGNEVSSNCPIYHAPSSARSAVRFSAARTTTYSQSTAHAAEAIHDAASLCGDDRARQAASTFGGLKYFNTDIDGRFRVLFVLGGPGAGKGTQSALIAQHYPVVHFSVGELLRNVSSTSPHKATIDAALVAGQIVPVEISLALLKTAMEEAATKHVLFLVDGFPRNFDNLAGWCRVMNGVAALESVLVYQCPLPVLQERILDRAKDSGRADDNLESVKKRFLTFEGETVPVVDALRRVAQYCPADQPRWSVVDIAGDRPVEDVWQSTQQVLERLILHDVLTANVALLAAVQAGSLQAYEGLCDPNFFTQENVATVMRLQEGVIDDAINGIQRAQVDVISGRQVAVSYERLLDGVLVREKRFWTHQGAAGWRNIHFARTPV